VAYFASESQVFKYSVMRIGLMRQNWMQLVRYRLAHAGMSQSLSSQNNERNEFTGRVSSVRAHGLTRMHTWTLLLVVFLVGGQVTNGFGQDRRATEWYEQALQSMRSGNLQQGEELLNRALERYPEYRDASLALADLYRETGRLDSASKVYSQMAALNPDDYVVSYRWGLILFDQGMYVDASRALTAYLESGKGGARGQAKARKCLANCDFAARALLQPVPFNPVDLGPAINTTDLEYFPAVTADGIQLIFTRNETIGRSYAEDFFRSFLTDTGWSASHRLPGEINTALNEGALSVSADGKAIFFTGCNRRDGNGSCDLYLSLWDSRGWGTPINLGYPINTAAWESQPSISADGRTLYFSSDRPGGRGGKDLWKSEYLGGRAWSEPVNLGDSINTPYDEITPFIHWDNESFYFSSDGHPGMGSLDLFRSSIRNGTFKTPKNLGYPINTAAEENGMIVLPDGTGALFSRDEGNSRRRNLDLYSFELPMDVRANAIRYVEGNLLDAVSGESVSGHLLVVDLETGDTLWDANLADGYFYLALQQSETYSFTAISSNYLPFSQRFTFEVTDVERAYRQNLKLNPLQSMDAVVLENVFFETGSYRLNNRSQYELKTLARFLLAHPQYCFEIGGHTDNVGTYADNLKLSEQRADAVIRFLVEEGVPYSMLRSAGYADTHPRANNSTEAGRAKNRRTELKRCQE